MVQQSIDKPTGTLEEEMRLTAEAGHSVWVRYDQFRERKHFTILIDGERLCDTDKPAWALRVFRVMEEKSCNAGGEMASTE